jgi:hypothetical protein
MSVGGAVEDAAKVAEVAAGGSGFSIWLLLGALVVGAAGGGYGAWWLQANRYEAQIADLKATQANELKAISDTATAAATAAQQKTVDLQNQVAALDAARTQENTNAQAENAKLRAAVAAGTRKLSVAGHCPAPAGGSGLPAGAAAAGVGDGAAAQRVDLDPATAGRLLAIAAAGDKAIRQLSACQAYVKVIIGGK